MLRIPLRMRKPRMPLLPLLQIPLLLPRIMLLLRILLLLLPKPPWPNMCISTAPLPSAASSPKVAPTSAACSVHRNSECRHLQHCALSVCHDFLSHMYFSRQLRLYMRVLLPPSIASASKPASTITPPRSLHGTEYQLR